MKVKSEYDLQADQFCETFTVEVKLTKYPPEMQDAPHWADDGKHGNRYRVKVSHPGLSAAKLSFDFWGSIRDREQNKHPSKYDILACLSSDSHCADDFDDFCGDTGYDSDSRKARKLWKRCTKFAKQIRAFFNAEGELDALREIS